MVNMVFNAANLKDDASYMRLTCYECCGLRLCSICVGMVKDDFTCFDVVSWVKWSGMFQHISTRLSPFQNTLQHSYWFFGGNAGVLQK